MKHEILFLQSSWKGVTRLYFIPLQNENPVLKAALHDL